jgi:hypothetical protein
MSLFAAPVPFTAALQSREVRSILRTTGKTRDLAKLDAPLRERAVFSATVASAELLQRFDTGFNSILEGKSDQATQRLAFKQLLDKMGYTVDAEIAGSLQDLRSDARLNLLIETNVDLARGYGQWIEGQQPDVLDEFPASELVRVRYSKVPRDWALIWANAGGIFFDGRMIALKNDPVWVKISRFELPYAPFDFGSGMDTVDIDRDEAESLKKPDGEPLITPSTVVVPQDREFNKDLQVTPAVRTQWLIDELENSGVGHYDDHGVFVFDERKAA